MSQASSLSGPVRGVAVLSAAVVLFGGIGALGVFRYARGYWLYRGFPPPRDPAFVTHSGTTEKVWVRSPALGGRRQEVYVYLPPGYSTSGAKRFPVFYLLHGFPGRPAAFLLTVRAGVVDDVLAAKRLARPMILVMPFGSTGTFEDKEWANGIGRDQSWETFVARDLVRAIDLRYRTIPTGAARALGGLSEGGYGALNIGFHHPGEFGVLESWSGYERADDLRRIFGHDRARLAWNSPLSEVPRVAHSLRQASTYVWFYSGGSDPLRPQNERLATELARWGIPHRYLVLRGGHNWGLWRANAFRALLVAARHLAHA